MLRRRQTRVESQAVTEEKAAAAIESPCFEELEGRLLLSTSMLEDAIPLEYDDSAPIHIDGPGDIPEAPLSVASVSDIPSYWNMIGNWEDVPEYIWHYGCGPTVAGMLFGWWDAQPGTTDLFQGDASTFWGDSSETLLGGPKSMVASASHIVSGSELGLTYGTYMDSPSYPNHTSNPASLADFIHTSDGDTWRTWMAIGLEMFAAWDSPWTEANESYIATTTNHYTSAHWGFDDFKAEIDAGRPVHLGITSHAVAALGYWDQSTAEDPDNYGYIGYTTWSGWGLQEWRWDGGNVPDGRWVYGATYLNIEARPEANTAPTITGLPDRTLDEDDSLTDTIDLWSYASDEESAVSELTFTIVGNTNSACGVSIVDNRYVSISPDADWHGISDVTVQVSDGTLTDTDTFRITVIDIPEPSNLRGDADGDWDVDGDDLAIWQQNYDPVGLNQNTFQMADWDGDGDVDGGDLAFWQQNYDPVGVSGVGFAAIEGSSAVDGLTLEPIADETAEAVNVTVPAVPETEGGQPSAALEVFAEISVDSYGEIAQTVSEIAWIHVRGGRHPAGQGNDQVDIWRLRHSLLVSCT